MLDSNDLVQKVEFDRIINSMDIQKYLQRIGYTGSLKCSERVLADLHTSHVRSIPFENIDVQNNVPIILSLNALFEKVINRQRGGFCYELNYLFYGLLNNLGFEVDMISSRIYNKLGVKGPEYDHMSLVVKLKENWLVDVGFGNLFIRPIPIIDEAKCEDQGGKFKINKIEDKVYLLSVSKIENVFEKKYEFNLAPRRIEDFENQCTFKQYHPESYFVENFICTLPTLTGRKTVFNDIFRIANGAEKVEKRIENKRDLISIITSEFNIDYPKRYH